MLLLLLLYYHRARLYILRQNYFSYLFDSSHAFIHHEESFIKSKCPILRHRN